MASLRRERIPIILCDRDRTADAWKELLEQFDGLSSPPLLIVASRLADDHLWVEALNLGAYDVLAKPFETAEVVRIFNLACLRWNQGNAALSAAPAARYWVA
jgi:DNA-binding response OmpR family regulator